MMMMMNDLENCYAADHCLSLLLKDYKDKGGICSNSYLDVNYPGVFPTSTTATCTFTTGTEVGTGICSADTRTAFESNENCIDPLRSQHDLMYRTIRDLGKSPFSFALFLGWTSPLIWTAFNRPFDPRTLNAPCL